MNFKLILLICGCVTSSLDHTTPQANFSGKETLLISFHVSLFTSEHCCLFTINLSSLSCYTELTPSDAGLQGILSIAPLWQELAVSLGVPFMTVKANESTSLGGMVCLSYWRNGCCGELYPHTWRFLLKTVRDSPTFGPLVAETIEKKAYSETSWSVLPAQLPGPSTPKVRLTYDPVF